MQPSQRPEPPKLLSTGIAGFDAVLEGGLPPRRMYLVQGDPGAGKTTLALQFLLAGRPRRRARAVRQPLGDARGARLGRRLARLVVRGPLDPRGVERPLLRTRSRRRSTSRRRWSSASGCEPSCSEIDRLRPSRIVLDSCSELRLLAQSGLRYRRQILALKRRLAELQLHHPPPRQPVSRRAGHAAAEPRARRHHDGAARPGVRRGAAAAARHEAARAALPRRLPRLRHPDRRRDRVPAARRGRAPRRSSAASRSRAASPSSTRSSAGAPTAARALLLMGPRAAASRPSRRSTRWPPRRGASAPRSSRSTRAPTCCSRGPRRSG